jgi:membrane-associated phospholipid phosphatase
MQDLLVRIAADWVVIPMIVATVVLIWRLPKKQRYQAAARAVATILLALLFAKLASLLYTGMRPYHTLGLEPGATFLDNPGFPSDHATLVFSLVIITWMITKSRLATLWMLLAAVVVAAGRVLAFVHWPLDVVGGAVFAGLAGFCMYGRGFFRRK